LLNYFLIFAWAVYAFESWLDWRQHRLYSVQHKPALLSYVTQEEFDKAQAYGRDKSTMGFVKSLWLMVKMMLQFYVSYSALLWCVSAVLLQSSDFFAGREWAQGELAVFFVYYVLDALIETVLGVPLQLVSTFIIEAKHGFNKQTLHLFIKDTILSLALNCIIAPPLLCLFIRVVQWGGDNFYLYVSGLFLVVQLLAVPVYINLIAPCFNKFDELSAGSLRTSIEQLAHSLSFPLAQLYVVDGSKRSSHSNAYFVGLPLMAKRIVLFDTLLAQAKEDDKQVLAVVGHELGHWKLNHTIKGLLLNQLQMLAMFYAFGLLLPHEPLYADFGFPASLGHGRPTYIGLMFFSCVWSPVQHVLSFLGNVVSRKHEFEADAFAADLGYGEPLKAGLITLQKENKSTPLPDPLFSAYHHSHPPLLERLQAIDKAMDKQTSKKTK
jgi:STE24 endopeptidase